MSPLSRVPGILCPGMRAAISGEPGRFVLPSDGVPGLDWHGETGTVRHLRGVGPIEEYADATILDDPTGATTGCLAAFCRGVYGIPRMYTVPAGDSADWLVLDGTRVVARGPTEAAAWRNAILAHPSLSELR